MTYQLAHDFTVVTMMLYTPHLSSLSMFSRVSSYNRIFSKSKLKKGRFVSTHRGFNPYLQGNWGGNFNIGA